MGETNLRAGGTKDGDDGSRGGRSDHCLMSDGRDEVDGGSEGREEGGEAAGKLCDEGRSSIRRRVGGDVASEASAVISCVQSSDPGRLGPAFD